MKKNNKKNIIWLIISLIILIITIKAFSNSRANKIVEIEANIIDKESLIKDEQVKLNGINEGEKGTSITLPNEINEKVVTKYFIEKKTLNEQNKTEIKNEIIEKTAGEKIYLTKEEEKNKKISLKVEYEIKKVKEENLYKKILKVEKNEKNKIENNITVTGFMPKDATLKIQRITEEELKNKAQDHIKESTKIKVAYDIKILVNEREFEPSDFDENVEVTITNVNLENEKKEQYKILHIPEEKEPEEIKEIELVDNKVKFKAKEFSTYALIEEPTIENIVEENSIYTNNLTTLNTQEKWDGYQTSTKYVYGDGTANKPFLISNGADLAFLRNEVGNGNTYQGKHFQLLNDIDLGGNEWQPIGNTNNSFQGIFDGAGHVIGNAIITISQIPQNVYESYGIFGSIGGTNSKTVIRNLEITDVNINITANGETNSIYFGSNSGGIHAGILIGTAYKNSNIRNVICKNSSIKDQGVITINDKNFHLSAGGVVGYISNIPNDNQDPGKNARYQIDNCFSDTLIELDSVGSFKNSGWSKYDNRGNYHTGGIVGTISHQPKWPEKCLYKGNIKSNGFIGPIFGAVVGNANTSSSDSFPQIWNGNNAGNTQINNMYYSQFNANNVNFTNTVQSGNSNARISNSAMGFVQGVNKGIYTNDMNQMLNMFNQNLGNNEELCQWIYENNTFSFKKRFTTKIEENPEDTYNVIVDDPYNSGNYIYEWYIDGTLNQSLTGSSYAWPMNYQKDENVMVITKSGSYYSINTFIITKVSVEIAFDVNEQNRSVTARLTGKGMRYATVSDYTFQWYKIDIVTGEAILPGENTLNLNNLEDYTEYKLVAKNINKPILSAENSFVFKGRNVVYVNYNNGNDSNDGRTDQTPVRTLSRGYSKLESGVNRNKNIIVIMGDYNESRIYNEQNGATYQKNSTITGRYNGKEYNGRIYLYGGSPYKFLNGDTTFQYLKFNGSGRDLYLYVQGYSLTMGEQVTMENYKNADKRQGLLGNNAPAFHIIAGWLQYDETRLPRNNAKILIKSGSYGRVLGGGSPGMSGGSELVQERSHNFMGSSKEDSFNVELTVDIQNSTKPAKYDYDVNLLVGGSACGNNYSNVTENIKAGSVGRLLGGSIGDSSDRPEGGSWWNPQIIPWEYPINTFLGTANINITGGTVNELYGGCLGRNMNALGNGRGEGYICDSYFYGTSNINISGGEVTNNIYGAGAGGVTGYNPNSSDKYKEAANFPSNAAGNSIPSAYNTEININITGGKVKGNIYGGGYGYTEYLTEATTATDGGALYGNSNINISGTPTIIGNIYGAGRGYNLNSKPEIAKMTGTSTININGTPSIQGEIFGAGQGIQGMKEMAKLQGDSNMNISANLNTSAYAGGNISKTTGNTNVKINDGNHTSAIYGGGNKGIVEGTANVEINGGINNQVFGGGNQATVTNTIVNINGGTNNQVFSGGNLAEVTNPIININSGNTTNAFGGGNQTNAKETHIYLKGGQATNIYGGSNQNGTVTNSYVETTTGIAENVYGGNNLGGTTKTSNVLIKGGNLTNIYGGGNQVETPTTNVNLENTSNVVTNVFGGGNQAGATTTNIIGNGGNYTNVFGGSNQNGIVKTSNVTINNGKYNNVYGGNNKGGKTLTSNVVVKGKGATNVYGGGNEAITNLTNVEINGEITGNLYGGGNLAEVETDTNINIINGIIHQNVYGGGNQGKVNKNTNVHIKNSTLKMSAYGGGNGSSAIVNGNTNILIDGTNTNIALNVFGGGNQAQTGTTQSQTSISTVNIAGGTIGKNVYGGANTSVVNGKTLTNIGVDTINNPTVEIGDILINGTVFGGGEANEQGDENYDFSFISVTKGIDMYIDGNKHSNFEIKGSIFGSGNASSTTGESKIDIKNYGTFEKPKSNISIQRTNTLNLRNSAITLAGATDRTNEYSSTYFSLSRVDRVKLINNSTLFLCNGANLLKNLDSILETNGIEEKSKVTINPDTGEVTEKNVDNRIYMLEGKNLNIATNEQATAYGKVSGMIFLGLFNNRHNPSTSTGIYNKIYNNGDQITNLGTFILNSYVMAEHMANHNLSIDGFYTNYNQEGNIKVNYIDASPKEDVYYMWLVGEKMDVTVFDVGLIASKYATLGTHELLLKGFSDPNTKFSIFGFSAGLENNIELVDQSEIKKIEENQDLANTKFGLEIRTGNVGWETKGRTSFYTKEGGTYSGTSKYNTDNSPYTPTLNICLYHAQNLSIEQNIGEVRIRFQVLTPIDDLNYNVSYMDINISMITALYQDDFYEAAITPGQEFGLFTTTETTISNKSAFSTYYSLYINDFTNNKYYQGFNTNKRVLVSRDNKQNPYSFPEKTTITMLDMVKDQYYYYVVTPQDVATGKYMYNLSDFILMGSTDSKFDETAAYNNYYDSGQNILYENFIFHVNFADAKIKQNIEDNTLLMEMQDKEQNTLIGVLGIQRENIKYSVYNNQEAQIKLNGNIDKNPLYLGQKLGMNISTKFNQLIIDSKTVYDTHYFDKKLGIKISIYDSNGERLNNDTLLGVNFELDGIKYYPRIDGTTRIKISDKVTDVLARIKMNTENNNIIPTGDYKIKIESFGSADGIYYGIDSSDMIEFNIKIINSTYGLKVTTSAQEKIVDNLTGKTSKGTNWIDFNIKYSSLYTQPEIRVELYRRNYDEIYSKNYESVDLANYVTNALKPTDKPNEYIAINNPRPDITQRFNLSENLVTGTYKMVYKLYDDTNYIGEAYEYIVIK